MSYNISPSLIHFTQCGNVWVHPCCCKWRYFVAVFWLRDIPLHIFICFSDDGHLGSFRVLAIVNSAAMNIGVLISFWIMFFSRYMLRRASLVAHTVKNLPSVQETWIWSLVGKIPWRREWLPIPVLLPRQSRGQRSLAGYSPWGCKKSGTTECARTEPLEKLSVWLFFSQITEILFWIAYIDKLEYKFLDARHLSIYLVQCISPVSSKNNYHMHF